MRVALLLVAAAALGAAPAARAAPPDAPRTVILVSLDGVRPAEIFTGADPALASGEPGGAEPPDELLRRFTTGGPTDRRAALLPFLWGVVARDGVLFGDPAAGSRATITNGAYVSYPGYDEMLAGFPDPAITGNVETVNPNLTVLEWLARQPALRGRVAAFASWRSLGLVLAQGRSGVQVNAEGPPAAGAASGCDPAIDELAGFLPHLWRDVRLDAVTMEGALAHLRARHPRVLYVALGETDEWAHQGRYGLYLDALRRADAFLARLWELVQSDPETRSRTTLIVTTDHGRGRTPATWTAHGRDVRGSADGWIAVLGPGVRASDVSPDARVTLGQVAASVAAAMGYDFGAAEPRAAPPLPGVARR